MSHTAPTVSVEQLACDLIAGLLGWDDREELGYPLSPGTEIHDNPDKIVFIAGTAAPATSPRNPLPTR